MTTTLAPRLRRITLDEVEIAYFERGHSQPERPTLLFAHATGFHGRIWDRIAERFCEHHIIALEHRGHGRSQKLPIAHWQVFGQDMARLVTALGLENVVGIGHSVGGHSMVDAAAISERFSHLLLLDPTIVSPQAYANPRIVSFPDGVHPAAKRRRHFESVDDMAERLRHKGHFPAFDTRMFADYCRYGLVRGEDGRLTLACPPEIEASVYMAARSNGGVYDSAAKTNIPVHIMRGREPSGERRAMDFGTSPTWPGLVRAFPNARETHLRECSHFIPFEIPERIENTIGQILSD